MQSSISCPVCSAFEYKIILDQVNSLYFPRRFVKCSNCGLVYVNPQPTMDELFNLYNGELANRMRRLFWNANLKDYTYRNNVLSDDITTESHQVQQSDITNTGEKRRAELRMRLIRKLCPPPGNVLDIGCRGGEFLMAAKANSYDIEGIEISSKYAQHSELCTGARVFSGTLEKYAECMPEKKQSYDIITMWDVIEHLLDPANTIREINRLQKQNGVLGLSTVNLLNYRYLRYGKRWRGFIESQEHIILFSPQTITFLLRRIGYEPIRILTRSIPPFMLKWLNLFKLGHELEVYARKVSDASVTDQG